MADTELLSKLWIRNRNLFKLIHFRFITQVGGETALTNDDVDFLLNAIGASDQDDISIDQLFKTLTTE